MIQPLQQVLDSIVHNGCTNVSLCAPMGDTPFDYYSNEVPATVAEYVQQVTGQLQGPFIVKAWNKNAKGKDTVTLKMHLSGTLNSVPVEKHINQVSERLQKEQGMTVQEAVAMAKLQWDMEAMKKENARLEAELVAAAEADDDDDDDDEQEAPTVIQSNGWKPEEVVAIVKELKSLFMPTLRDPKQPAAITGEGPGKESVAADDLALLKAYKRALAANPELKAFTDDMLTKYGEE